MDDQIAKQAAGSDHEARSAPPVPKELLADTLKVRVVHRKPETAGPLPPKPATQAAPEPKVPTVEMTGGDEGIIDDLPPAEPLDDTPGKAQGNSKSFLAKYWQHKLWTLPLTVVGVLLIGGGAVMAMPVTRYRVLAHFITNTFTVSVTDSTTGSPVTGATVTLDGASKTTDSGGKASLRVPVGQGTVVVRKTYYKDASRPVLVDLSASANMLAVHLVATGRQVPVKVVNKITGKPIPEAVITAGSADAKTDLNGLANIVLPASPETQNATVTVDGYNSLSATVQVTTQVVDANTFAMVPVGRVFFLSNLSGKLDVVSTDLDGSDRKTVVAGTGSEDPNNTILLASHDWQYLMLLSARDDGTPKLYVINTGNGKMTTADSTNANLTPVGWSGHYFVYRADRGDLNIWEPGRTTLKSYNADTGSSATLRTTTASGTDQSHYLYQDISNVIFLGGNVVYSMNWYASSPDMFTNQSDVLWSNKADGSGSAQISTIDASQLRFDNLTLANPGQAYFQTTSVSSANYYRVDANGSVSQSSTINQDSVTRSYPVYLVSPSATLTFWSDASSGNATLFTGDANGGSSNTIASSSPYIPYGWFSDSYLLVERGGSALYIMPVAGGTPLKISDYYKPQNNLYGYGGGYGGL